MFTTRTFVAGVRRVAFSSRAEAMARGAFPKITKCLRITEKGMFTVPKPAPSPIVIYNTPTYATKSIHVTTFGPKSSRAGTNGSVGPWRKAARAFSQGPRKADKRRWQERLFKFYERSLNISVPFGLACGVLVGAIECAEARSFVGGCFIFTVDVAIGWMFGFGYLVMIPMGMIVLVSRGRRVYVGPTMYYTRPWW